MHVRDGNKAARYRFEEQAKAERMEERGAYILRFNRCMGCGKTFTATETHIVCPACKGNAAMLADAVKDEGIPNGNLPRSVDRIMAPARPVTGIGLRPKTQGDIFWK